MARRSDAPVAAWLDELPALASALDVDPKARRLLLVDAASDSSLLAGAGTLHPVLAARAHLAQAAIQLLLADAGDGEAAAKRCAEVCNAAFETAITIAACGPRLRLLPPVGGVAASALPFLRHSDRRVVHRLLARVAEATAEAFDEQAELAGRGAALLAAASALADGASVVEGGARAAVRARAAGMAEDARRDLVNAAELSKARIAADLVDALTT